MCTDRNLQRVCGQYGEKMFHCWSPLDLHSELKETCMLLEMTQAMEEHMLLLGNLVGQCK